MRALPEIRGDGAFSKRRLLRVRRLLASGRSIINRLSWPAIYAARTFSAGPVNYTDLRLLPPIPAPHLVARLDLARHCLCARRARSLLSNAR